MKPDHLGCFGLVKMAKYGISYDFFGKYMLVTSSIIVLDLNSTDYGFREALRCSRDSHFLFQFGHCRLVTTGFNTDDWIVRSLSFSLWHNDL